MFALRVHTEYPLHALYSHWEYGHVSGCKMCKFFLFKVQVLGVFRGSFLCFQGAKLNPCFSERFSEIFPEIFPRLN